ncbi:MAG: phospholipase D family protein [Clostridia bacterium]|nr:phospholipase D family protein [Clostridia bacterium]
MFNPNNDRLDYGQLLAPPAEYELDFAVGTTYSLDLDALVGASLSLSLSEETDSVLMNNAVCLLEALRDTGDKVALFCENGQIHYPNHVNHLYILLEKMVFPVKIHKRRGMTAYPSFHPKMWLIRYKNRKNESRYRFIVLSRNLTFDRSWDITCAMDGQLGEAVTSKNEPLCDFLRYLVGQLPSDVTGKRKARGIRSMIRELYHVIFQLEDKDLKWFHDYSFVPGGIHGANGKKYQFSETPLFRNTFHEIVIISPFLSGKIIRSFNDRNRNSLIKNDRYMLITRGMSLGNLKPEEISNFKDDIYVMKENIVDGEAAISEDAGSIQRQDIHAKIYMIRKHSETDLYLGSMNASRNAVYGNVEFMLCLHTYRSNLNMDKMKAALFGKDPEGPDNPFEKVHLDVEQKPAEEDKAHLLEMVIKEIGRCNQHAMITENSDGTFDAIIDFATVDTKDYQVSIHPLLSKETAPFAEHIVFSGLTLLQISEFYAISASDGEETVSRVILISTEGMPEQREKEVVSSVIRDQDSFYRYIIFLLGDENILSLLETGELSGNGSFSFRQSHFPIPALYERMLRTAAAAPEKFKGIEYLMKTISEDGVIPDEFRKLYDIFRKAVGIRG